MIEQSTREATVPPKLNPTLEGVAIPGRIRALPLAPNGFPVPWFVAWVDGVPEFRAMDYAKFVRAIKEKRCWVCGEPLGKLMTFVVGPMCGINRTSSEPPSHLECARFSARYCPFLSRPHMDRRENGLEEIGACPAAGHMIRRNPGCTLLWTTRAYSLFGDGAGGVLIRIGEPDSVEWWREGRAATRAEVEESVRTGLPVLKAMVAEQGGGASFDLARRRVALTQLYPGETAT